MPGRYASSASYRYGFNGHEHDDELKSDLNSYDFGARMYDPRLGRFLSTDPWERKYAWQTPYAYFANSPISKIDWKGFGDGDDESPVESPQPDTKGTDVKPGDNNETNPFKTGQGRFGTSTNIPSEGGSFTQSYTSVEYKNPWVVDFLSSNADKNVTKVYGVERNVEYGYDDSKNKFSIETTTISTEITITIDGTIKQNQTKTYQLEVYEVNHNRNQYNGLKWNTLGKRIMNSKTTTKINVPYSVEIKERLYHSIVLNRKTNDMDNLPKVIGEGMQQEHINSMEFMMRYDMSLDGINP